MGINSNRMNDPEESPKPKPKPEQSGAGKGGKKKPTAVGSGGDDGGGRKKWRSGGGHEENDEMAPTLSKPVNLYKLLQVDPEADSGLIRQAYRYLAEKYHPDNKVTGDAEMFTAITEAWKLLSDYAKRAIYDDTLTDEEE